MSIEEFNFYGNIFAGVVFICLWIWHLRECAKDGRIYRNRDARIYRNTVTKTKSPATKAPSTPTFNVYGTTIKEGITCMTNVCIIKNVEEHDAVNAAHYAIASGNWCDVYLEKIEK